MTTWTLLFLMVITNVKPVVIKDQFQDGGVCKAQLAQYYQIAKDIKAEFYSGVCAARTEPTR